MDKLFKLLRFWGDEFKSLLVVLFLLIGIGEALAGPRDFLQAQKIAQQKAIALGSSIGERNIQQARAKGRGADTPQQTTPYYIFNFDDGTGYAIVGGDDRMPAIVGYSDKGTLNPDSLPENLKSFLASYKATVEAVEKGDTVAMKNVKAAISRTAGSYTPVEPLLGGIEWGQMGVYNFLCPQYEGEGRSATGCVATAMAQIMRYWKWPSILQEDIPGYVWRGEQIDTISKGFVYDWDNMKETYNTIDYTSVQDTAVASLMLHVGVSVSSQYAYSGTGAGSRDVPEALATYFGYDKQTMTELERQNFEWDDWNSILQKELVLRRPIFYSGYRGNNFAGGHAFVCDGIDNDGYYHINWGWSGSCNGYFDITILNSEKDKSHAGEYMQAGFCKDNCIIVGIQPADGLEHEPPFAFDRLGILLSSACFEKKHRESQTETFSGTVGINFFKQEIPKVLCALGIKDEDGKYVCISTDRKWVDANNVEAAPVLSNETFSFEYAFPKGTYSLFVIQSTDEGKSWQACSGKGRQVELYVSDYDIFDKYSRYKNVEIDGIKANIDKLEECATIVANDYSGYSGSIVIPEYIAYEGNEYKVTTIGENCFYYSNITHVTLPKSIRSLGGYCFIGCKKLQSVKIPEGVEIIPEVAFFNCSSLRSVDLPNSVKEIGSCAFSHCDSLANIIIPEGVEVIRDAAFQLCSSLRSVDLPNSVKELGGGCFYECTSLESVIINGGVSIIPNSCFEGCSSLRSVDLPNSVKELGGNCFYKCTSLASIIIPGGVTKIPQYCFLDCSSLKSVIIREGVTEIPEYCFMGCSSLKSVELPSSVREFGDFCFSECTSLASIIIPEGVTKIPFCCFDRCSSLASIDLSSSVRELGHYCFANCVPDVIYLRAKSVPTNFSNSFDHGDSFYVRQKKTVLYVPEESLDDYKRECGNMFKEVLPLEAMGVADVLLDGLKISVNGGKLELTGLQEGMKVRLFSLDGKCIGENAVSNGKVSFSTTEPMVIAKIGNKSVKIVTSKNL